MDVVERERKKSAEELTEVLRELRNETDVQARVDSAGQLSLVADALGPERCRNELLPYVNGVVDDDDEVLEVLCLQLGGFVPYVGGGQYAHILLEPLESMAAAEEAVVRRKAVDALASVAVQMPTTSLSTYFIPLVRRLVQGKWFTQRSSAAGLLHVVYPLVTDTPMAADLLASLSTLAGDSAVMVRRAIATNMANLIPVLSQDVLTTVLLPIWSQLCSDGQDSVRLVAVGLSVQVAEGLGPVNAPSIVLPIFLRGVGDEAWRIRYVAAECCVQLQKPLGPSVSHSDLLPSLVELLADPEAEVRTAAAGTVLTFARQLSKEVCVDSVINMMLPKLKAICENDEVNSQHVRLALASELMGLSSLIGKEHTIKSLLPLFLQLLKDEGSEVRLKVISNLEEVNSVVGIGPLSEALLPAINELASDSNWRIRQQIIKHIPVVAKQLGVTFFDDNLSALCLSWLLDKVHAVRLAAVENIKSLISVFGLDWAKTNGSMLPKVLEMASNAKNFTARIISVCAIHSLVDICTDDVITHFFVPVLCSLHNDKIPNIRFNVCKSIAKVLPHVAPPVYTAQIKEPLARLVADDDMDVRFHANFALGVASTCFGQ